MMQLIRDRAQGVFVWLIVAFIIITFATFGLSSYLSGPTNAAVATVNGVEISNRQYDQAYQNFTARMQQQQGANYRPDLFPASFIRGQVIRSLTTEIIFEQYLAENGFSVSTTQIQENLFKENAFFGDDNKFSKLKYREVLAQQSINVESYENGLKKQIIQQQLYAGLQDTAFILNTDIEKFNKLKNQQRDVGVLNLSFTQYKNDVVISDDMIKDYYQSHLVNYMTEEMLSVDYVELKLDETASKYDVTDNDAKTYYDSNISTYTDGIEKRKVRHILINVNKKTDDATAKKQITELHQKLIAGDDFIELAKLSSQDIGSSKKGGDLGLVSKGENAAAFDDAAFKLKKGQYSEPVRSRFGYHLIKVDEIQTAEVKSFKSVMSDIKLEIQKNKAEDDFYKDFELMDKIAYESSDSLEPVKNELNLEIKTSELFSRATGGKGIFADERVNLQVFSDDVMNQSRNSSSIELSDTHYVVVRLAKRQAAAQQSFETVKKSIKTKLLAEKANELIAASLTTAYDKLSNGESGVVVANSIKHAKWVRFGYINRNQANSGNNQKSINPIINKKAFSLSRPSTSVSLDKMELTGGDKSVIVVFGLKDGKQTVATKPKEQKTETTNTPEVTAIDNKLRALTSANREAELRGFIDFIREQSEIKIYNQSPDQI